MSKIINIVFSFIIFILLVFMFGLVATIALAFFIMLICVLAAIYYRDKCTTLATQYENTINDINNQAINMIHNANDRLYLYKKDCEAVISKLGEKKIWIVDKVIRPFISEFDKLQNVKFVESSNLNELQEMALDKENLAELKELIPMAEEMSKGMLTGSTTKAIISFAAYGTAGILASSSNETAIATLGGATKNLSVSLDDGSLAGKIEVAPLEAFIRERFFGAIGRVQIKNKLEETAQLKTQAANSNLEQAKASQNDMNKALEMCIKIRKRSSMFARFLLSLNAELEPFVYEINSIMEDKGVDFGKYSDSEKDIVFNAVAIVCTIKLVLDMPILNTDGTLNTESDSIFTIKHSFNQMLFNNN